jgi:hypothetical protein
VPEFDQLYWVILRWTFLGTFYLLRGIWRLATRRPLILLVLVFLFPVFPFPLDAQDAVIHIKVGVMVGLILYMVARRLLGGRHEEDVPVVPIDPA